MEKHYERADIDAMRADGGKSYDIKTHNVSRLCCAKRITRKMIKIDGQDLKVKPRPEIALQKTGSAWKVDSSVKQQGLHKTHALQGPIDDAFLDPFLLVRPDRHAVERRRKSAGAAYAGALRPHVGEVLPRPSLRQRR